MQCAMSIARALSASALLALLAGLSGCAAETPRERGEEADGMHDPVMSAAIEGQLLVDPDLTQANQRNLAVVPAGPVDPAQPLPDPPGK
jgi:hypothetical protein